MKKIISLILMLALVVCFFVGCGTTEEAASQPATQTEPQAVEEPADDTVYVAKLSHTLSAESQYQNGALFLQQKLDEYSNGRIKLEIYPAAQLGGEKDSAEGLNLGTLEFAIVGSSLLADVYNLPTDVFILPWLYNDSAEAYDLWASDVTAEIFAPLKEHGMEALGFWDSGLRQFSNSKHPINTVADLKDLKFRIPESSVYMQTATALGISPFAMPFADVYSAMQTGVVDGTEAPMANYIVTGFKEVQPYVAIVNYASDPIAVLVSNSFMDKLPADLQEAVRKAVAESVEFEHQWLADYVAANIADLETYGIEFTYPDNSTFLEAVKPVYQNYHDQETMMKVLEYLGKTDILD